MPAQLAAPSPSPTDRPTASPAPTPQRSFLVYVTDGGVETHAPWVRFYLGSWWQDATAGRAGTLAITERPIPADFTLIINPRSVIATDVDIERRSVPSGTYYGRGVVVVNTSIVIRRNTIVTQTFTEAELRSTILHEIAHHWCCHGPGTVDSHWLDCPDLGLMCSTGSGGRQKFSEREVAVLRSAMGY